jgi:hypothetical protein
MSTTAGSTLAAIAEVEVVPVAGVGDGVALLLDGAEEPPEGFVVVAPVDAVAGAVWRAMRSPAATPEPVAAPPRKRSAKTASRRPARGRRTGGGGAIVCSGGGSGSEAWRG